MRFGAMVVGATGTGKSSLLRTLQVIFCAPSAFTLLSVVQCKCRLKACDTSCAMPSAYFMLVSACHTCQYRAWTLSAVQSLQHGPYVLTSLPTCVTTKAPCTAWQTGKQSHHSNVFASWPTGTSSQLLWHMHHAPLSLYIDVHCLVLCEHGVSRLPCLPHRARLQASEGSWHSKTSQTAEVHGMAHVTHLKCFPLS